jgi:hypothetical protein
MRKSLYFVFRVLIILHLSTLSLYAQGGDAPITPIDGGTTFLAAAGLAYGLKKVHDHNRKNKSEEE